MAPHWTPLVRPPPPGDTSIKVNNMYNDQSSARPQRPNGRRPQQAPVKIPTSKKFVPFDRREDKEIRGVRWKERSEVVPTLRREDDVPETSESAENASGAVGIDRKREVKVVGTYACLALFKVRPQDVIRVYLTQTQVKEFSTMLSWCAQQRKAYHIVTNEDLEKISGTEHHEGVCILTKRAARNDFRTIVEKLAKAPGPSCIILLENVQNPHNLGALLRVGAHFGAGLVGVINHGPNNQMVLPTATYRVAEGGAEYVPVADAGGIESCCKILKRNGFKVLGTSGRAKLPLPQADMGGKVAIMFGSETRGLSDSALDACDSVINIPGTGNVRSLNISCASAVVLGHWAAKV